MRDPSDLEAFIQRSNPEAFERWSIWHQQSLLTREQVVNQETRDSYLDRRLAQAR